MAVKIVSLCALAILTPLTSLHASQPRVIYGSDDRLDYYQVRSNRIRQNADATVALLRASALSDSAGVTSIVSSSYGASMGLCLDEPFYSQDTAAFCSGFLVAPDLVVTAGHCIRDQAGCDGTRFVFNFKMSAKDVFPHAVPSTMVFACKSVVRSVSTSGEDFAVIKLDRRVTHTTPLAYRTSGKITLDEDLRVIGYPMGLPVKIAGGAKVRSLQAEFLVANLDTYGGNSGSAVFNTQTGLVEGVLVRGEMDFTYTNNCRTSNKCPDDGCRGEDVTLFERILPFLN